MCVYRGLVREADPPCLREKEAVNCQPYIENFSQRIQMGYIIKDAKQHEREGVEP